LRREQPTILHSYRDKANLWARLAAFAAPVPIVLTSVRNRYQGPFYGPLERVLQHKSSRVLVNSIGIEEELVDWSGVTPSKIQVINNFIDLGRFVPPTDAERSDARAQYGIAPNDLALILPGRLALQKHQLGLGLALSYLKRAGRLPRQVRLLLAGRKRDKTYSRIVPAWFRALGLSDQVTYLEPLTDVASLYHAADALVMPSLYEGLPNAVLEAHACGLPAVVSHAANRDSIVADGVTGYEVATLDHRGLAEAIGTIIELSDDERRAMGERGRERVTQRFHPDRITAEMVTLYDSLLAEKGLA
jgi:UDP-glucose:(heptosyl)LPS alpha-1,3-glucosyltransferase